MPHPGECNGWGVLDPRSAKFNIKITWTCPNPKKLQPDNNDPSHTVAIGEEGDRAGHPQLRVSSGWLLWPVTWAYGTNISHGAAL